jgi:hypothetical protein
MHSQELEARFGPLVEDLLCPRAICGDVRELSQIPTQLGRAEGRGFEWRM